MEKHPSDIETFYAKHPSFLYGPGLLAVFVRSLCAVPFVNSYLKEMDAAPYGLSDATMYTAFAILLSYASHGWMCVHLCQSRQLQAYDKPNEKNVTKADQSNDKDVAKARARYVDKIPPSQEAVRTIAALLTSLVYTVYPFAPATNTWATFIAWTMALAVYWDLHFFFYHKAAHESRTLYVWFHKLHHENKQPGPFNAYFVTYQSHLCAEHLVVLVAALCGLPRDVFTWTLWWGTLGTLVEHCGHDVGSLSLPFLGRLGVTWDVLGTALSPWSLVLGGEAPAEHDWHHEKFTANYALSFQYLDKLFGTYHPGRIAGEAIKPKPPVASNEPVSEDDYEPIYRSVPPTMSSPAQMPLKDKDVNKMGKVELHTWCSTPPSPCHCSGLEVE